MSGLFKTIPARPLVPSVYVSKDPNDWKEIIKRATYQVAYRQLGMVSLHVPLNVAVQSIRLLVKDGYGRFRWLIPGRVGLWENVPVVSPDKPAIRINIYVFGSKIRQKNTVFVRVGWWKMYVIDAVLMTIGMLQQSMYKVLGIKYE